MTQTKADEYTVERKRNNDVIEDFDMGQMRETKERDIEPLDIEFKPDKMIPKIVDFCEAMSGIDLFPYQREYAEGMVRSLVLNDGEELTALFARQSGKTETNAVVAVGCMVILPRLAKLFPDYEPMQIYKNGLRVGVFAPTGGQAQTTYGRMDTRIRSKKAQMILDAPDIDIELEDYTRLIALDNGSIAISLSANKNAKIESKTMHFMILEEAQDMDTQVIRKSIRPMGAATNATIIMVGTANSRRSEFLEGIKRNRRRNMDNSRTYHFEYDYKVASKYNKRYKKYIEKEKERIGEDSDEFRMAYKCEFILERGMFIIEKKFEELCDIEPNMDLVQEKRTGTQVAGIDLGKRNDSTVVTIIDVDYDNPVKNEMEQKEHYRKKVLNWLELKGDNYNDQYSRIIDFLKNYNVKTIYIDATGQGEIMSDRLERYFVGDVDVISYTFSTKSKSRMYKYLDKEIHAGRLAIPNGSRAERYKKWKKFRQQMLDLEKDWRGQYMVVSHPPRKDAHDDYADSLALAMMASKSEDMPEIETEQSPFFDKAYDTQMRFGEKKKAGRSNEELFG